MNYKSTRGKAPDLGIEEAIIKGIASDGGLYVPERFPRIEKSWDELSKLGYKDLAFEVLKPYFESFTGDELRACIDGAYDGKFEAEDIVPVVKAGGAWYLELYHGRTAAFKDMALSMLPYLLTTSMKKTGEKKTVVILVSTSGDTGMAALKGFEDVPGTKIIVFFPDGGVSAVQEKQMRTATGSNVSVLAIRGNFDDAQTTQKKILNDAEFGKEMAGLGFSFTAANSMNIGRLLPQIVYYVWGYVRLVGRGEIKAGDPVNICVPSGNFGNILAGYYAYRMGVPVNRFICASNKNKVLTDFFASGRYDADRPLYQTNAPSMDIIVSSNLERLLYHLEGDPSAVAGYMSRLDGERKYSVSEKTAEGLRLFDGGFATEEEIVEFIGDLYAREHYLVDTHTAVAGKVLSDYRKRTGDETPALIASTASPYKFAQTVAGAIGLPGSGDPFKAFGDLCAATGVPVPGALRGLSERKILHGDTIDKEDMKQRVREILTGKK